MLNQITFDQTDRTSVSYIRQILAGRGIFLSLNRVMAHLADFTSNRETDWPRIAHEINVAACAKRDEQF